MLILKIKQLNSTVLYLKKNKQKPNQNNNKTKSPPKMKAFRKVRRKRKMLWANLCLSKNASVKSQDSSTSEVTIFGDWGFTVVIKLK